MKKKSINYTFIPILLALVLLIASLFIPWLKINFITKYSYTPFKILKELFQNNTPDLQIKFNLLYLMKSFTYSYFALIFSIVIFLSSITILLASFILKKQKSNFVLIAGILAIISGVLWIYSIESFKVYSTQNAISSGGIIGEEFKGKESIIINSIIKISLGNKLVIIAGTILILAYLWKPKKELINNF